MNKQNDCQKRREAITAFALGELEHRAADELKKHIDTCETCRCLYHALVDEEKTIHSAFKAIADRSESLQHNLVKQLGKHDIASPQIYIRSRKTVKVILSAIMKSRITKLAAAAVIIVSLLLLFSDSQTTLYAQVMKAIENTRTIHVVGKALRNDKWEKTTEIWYQRGVGVKLIVWSKDKEIVRFDNGEYEWKFSSGNDFALQKKSIGQIRLPREILAPEKYLNKCERDSIGDMVIDGFQCDLYAATHKDNSHGQRVMFWIDPHKRVRRFEEYALNDDEWVAVEICEVEYDVEINPKILLPDFGPDVRIVECDKIVDSRFELSKALFTKEALDLIFAVHELKRCEGGFIYSVCSLRPTDAIHKKVVSSDHEARNYGDFDFYQGPSVGKWKYYPIQLASIYDGGFMVKWFLLRRNNAIDQKIEICELPVRIDNSGKLFGRREKRNLPTRQLFNPIAVLPLSEENVTLDNLLTEIYARTLELEPFVAIDSLNLQSVPYTDEEMNEWARQHEATGIAKLWLSQKAKRLYRGRTSKPSKIDKEVWIEDRLDYLQKYRNR